MNLYWKEQICLVCCAYECISYTIVYKLPSINRPWFAPGAMVPQQTEQICPFQ